MNNLRGKIFSGVLVIDDVGKRNKKKEILWLCECLACGKRETLARKTDLERGDYQSCGCLKAKIYASKISTHGRSRTTEYKIWSGIKERCCNTNSPAYFRYGGRGIKMCKRWRDSFENFLEDMGERPSKDYSIDRINNNKGYSKSNCRWATASQQAYNRNKQIGVTSRYKNIHFDKRTNRWVVRLWLNNKRIRIGAYTSEREAKRNLDNFRKQTTVGGL